MSDQAVHDAVAAERARCLALIDLTPGSGGVSAYAIDAITNGQSAEDFAIGLARQAKGGGRIATSMQMAADQGHPNLAHMRRP